MILCAVTRLQLAGHSTSGTSLRRSIYPIVRRSLCPTVRRSLSPTPSDAQRRARLPTPRSRLGLPLQLTIPLPAPTCDPVTQERARPYETGVRLSRCCEGLARGYEGAHSLGCTAHSLVSRAAHSFVPRAVPSLPRPRCAIRNFSAVIEV
ncbi:hypothetical protein PLICRDRAFT_646448 [Plicaturopsis crispa FD-325 SS-3]|nr:hypothetical protein PLICRDRAFT_646448 [Plicaturopsis crispa FD-325 SS-3]